MRPRPGWGSLGAAGTGGPEQGEPGGRGGGVPVINRIAAFHDDMTAWRRDLHAHPETAFEEERTSALVAGKLAGFGLEVHRGLAGTGVVATLRAGSGSRAIALRADMDALHIQELNDFAHRSRHDGKMHACGHDGHTAMLLGAARYLAETRHFDGTVHFVFQPAEENEGGGRVMVEEGLFDRFPVEAVYGMHNWPGMEVGRFGVLEGPVMAAFDVFEITIEGRGCHAAMPHLGVDPVVAAGSVIQNLQIIVSRRVSPLDSGVVSLTQIHGGDTWNVIPETVVMRGTARSFEAATRDLIEATIHAIGAGVEATHGVKVTLRYDRRYPATINTAAETELAATAAGDVVGATSVLRDLEPSMASEDFAFMLQARPGAYVWIGNGSAEDGRMLHSPHYDFNDEILPIGATWWARLVETVLPASA